MHQVLKRGYALRVVLRAVLKENNCAQYSVRQCIQFLRLCICVCVFIKVHITAQSGPVIPSHSMTIALVHPRGGCVRVWLIGRSIDLLIDSPFQRIVLATADDGTT